MYTILGFQCEHYWDSIMKDIKYNTDIIKTKKTILYLEELATGVIFSIELFTEHGAYSDHGKSHIDVQPSASGPQMFGVMHESDALSCNIATLGLVKPKGAITIETIPEKIQSSDYVLTDVSGNVVFTVYRHGHRTADFQECYKLNDDLFCDITSCPEAIISAPENPPDYLLRQQEDCFYEIGDSEDEMEAKEMESRRRCARRREKAARLLKK